MVDYNLIYNLTNNLHMPVQQLFTVSTLASQVPAAEFLPVYADLASGLKKTRGKTVRGQS